MNQEQPECVRGWLVYPRQKGGMQPVGPRKERCPGCHTCRRSTKQVIIIRRDLKMRRGKEIAQGGHGVAAFMTRNLHITDRKVVVNGREMVVAEVLLTPVAAEWLDSSFRKITLQVPNEEELLSVYEKARNAGLQAHLVSDAGRTEFGGMVTNTAVVIGPDFDADIDPITGHLELY